MVGSKWHHKRRRTVYEVIVQRVVLQCAGEQKFEDMFLQDVWTVYRDVDSGHHYVRPTKEFLDGRFERVRE